MGRTKKAPVSEQETPVAPEAAGVSVPETVTPNDVHEVSADDLAVSHIEGMSEPTDSEILKKTEPAPVATGAVQSSQIRDSEGTVFNPAIHSHDENGKPKINAKTGTFRKARKSQVNNPNKSAVAAVEPEKVKPVVNYRANAEAFLGLVEYGATSLINDEWAFDVDRDPKTPKNVPTERETLTTALENYTRANEIGDASPGVVLILTVGMYIFSRIQKPKTKAWIDDLRGIKKEDTKPDEGKETSKHPANAPESNPVDGRRF